MTYRTPAIPSIASLPPPRPRPPAPDDLAALPILIAIAILCGVVSMVLDGCAVPMLRGSERPPREAHSRAVDALVTAWRAEGLPYPQTCLSERSRLAVAVVDNATMVHATARCASGSPVCVAFGRDSLALAEHGCRYGYCIGGAQIREREDVWPVGLATAYRVTLIVSTYEPPIRQGRLLVHEAGHWLSRCALGGEDHEHADVRVWSLVRRVQDEVSQ